MTLPHESGEFEALLAIVAQKTGVGEALVEKDYWVTHTLWLLQRSGLEIYFKGGTSLSKGFNLIQRFSEDIDAWLQRGTVADLPEVSHWTRTSKGHVESRRRFYEALPALLEDPKTRIEVTLETLPNDAREALFFVRYPGVHLGALASPNLPYIQLEVGYTEVVPNVPITIGSFVHDHLSELGRLGEFQDNRPQQLPTVHPLSTLIEKLDAISHRYHRRGDGFAPATFVRHYEDAAWIIRGLEALPRLDESPRQLADQMVLRKQLRKLPNPKDDAFLLGTAEKRELIEESHDAIEPMFWGGRIPLMEASEAIITWLEEQGIGPSEGTGR